MRIITKKGLRRHLEERVAFGGGMLTHRVSYTIYGNEPNEVDAGILLEDESGFYVNVRKRRSLELSLIRRIKQYDIIAVKAKKQGGRNDVRFYEVDLPN